MEGRDVPHPHLPLEIAWKRRLRGSLGRVTWEQMAWSSTKQGVQVVVTDLTTCECPHLELPGWAGLDAPAAT